MGLGAVADYQQSQREKLERQRFADLIQETPVFDPGQRTLASNFVQLGQTDIAMKLFQDAIAADQKKREIEAERAGFPSRMSSLFEEARRINPRASVSAQYPGGGASVTWSAPPEPKEKEPKTYAPDKSVIRNYQNSGRDVEIVRQWNPATGKFEQMGEPQDVGPYHAPAPRDGDGDGKPTERDYLARARGETTGIARVDRLSPAQAAKRLSPSAAKALAAERKGGRTPAAAGAPSGGPQMSDAAKRLAARFGIGQ